MRQPIMPSTVAIKANDLEKRYSSVSAVEGLNLVVPQGSVYGFLGPNGAGKTTTMQLLTTLATPTNGQARIMDKPITDRNKVIPHIGYLPDEPPLYEELSAYEQLTYIADLRNMSTELARDRIQNLLTKFDLADEADKQIATYSKGMRQKTAFIQAILHDPEVLFLDEPTSGLDPRAARTIRDLILSLADDGMCVFLSTHILPVVEELATTIGVLCDGQLVTEGTPEQLKRRAETAQEDTLEDVFLKLTTDESAETSFPDG